MSLHSPVIELRPVDSLKPYPRNGRRHSKGQIHQIAESIRRFGFTNPVLNMSAPNGPAEAMFESLSACAVASRLLRAPRRMAH